MWRPPSPQQGKHAARTGKHAARRRLRVHPLVLTVGVLTAVVGGATLTRPGGASPSAATEAVTVVSGSVSAPQVPVPGIKRLVVYGHSMPSGGGATDVTSSYAVLTAEATGLRLVNRAEGGTSAILAARAMAAHPAAGPHDAVVIHTGMNDIFRRRDDALTRGRPAIRDLLAGSARAGRRVLVLECQPASWLDTPPGVDLQRAYDAWNRMLRHVAAAFPGVGVLDTCQSWDPFVFTDVPKYHPNDEGHALIARELAAMLSGTSRSVAG